MTKDEERLERLKGIVRSMPEKPGSYQYYDAEGTIIYVGKAKNLKARVSSYFHKEVDRYKTKVLVSKIQNISYTVVNSEEDALILENALIKQYNPRYNVLLKDGKTYPSICVTGEMFPRIFKTRTVNKKWGQYFGPYSHLGSMYTVLDLIHKLYKPRRCQLPLTLERIEKGDFKPCLEYHIHNCGAPCCGKQSYEDYKRGIEAAKEILKGNTRALSDHIYTEMMQAAEELRFEDAEVLKKQYLLIDQFQAKSEVVSHTISNVDVFCIDDDDAKENAFINYMHVTNGTITQSFTYEYKRKLDETDEELLLTAITEIRERFQSTAREIVVPFEMHWQVQNATFTVPQRGDRHHLLELSQMNCRQYRVDRLKQSDKLNPEQRSTRLMKELQEKLGLPHLPMRIELFDNSNISGTDAVAGCVVYIGMKKSPKDYRKYDIKTVTGPDDYASMQEVVRRRYAYFSEQNDAKDTKQNSSEINTGKCSSETKQTTESIAEKASSESKQIAESNAAARQAAAERCLPDLIICDGGIGQMNCVREVIEDELQLSIPIAGLAKDDRHRTNELLFGFPPRTVQLKPGSELFRTLTAMQDEVHRYAITFHRDKRSKHALHSELDDIRGIGPKAIETLLQHFKSVKRIRQAAADANAQALLAAAVGNAKARTLIEYFRSHQ